MVAASAVVGLLIVTSADPATATSIDAARRQLRDIIEDVAGATAFRYGVTDDRGRSMDTADVIWVPEANAFAAVYHSLDRDGIFEVHLATSDDLLDWTWRTRLAERASQATIVPATDGGYVVAWEQSPDPIHLALALFESWPDLLAATPARRISAPVTTPGCGEGTPAIDAASSRRVSVTFHYHASCRRDRQAMGATNWKSWRASTRPVLDRALMRAGADGHIGDRDEIVFMGNRFTVIEGQLALDVPGSWRTFLYDGTSQAAERLRIRTHGGTPNAANPTVSRVVIDGRPAILVTVFLFSEGARTGEAGELIYYRVDKPDVARSAFSRHPS
jgi:hypothetical protein